MIANGTLRVPNCSGSASELVSHICSIQLFHALIKYLTIVRIDQKTFPLTFIADLTRNSCARWFLSAGSGSDVLRSTEIDLCGELSVVSIDSISTAFFATTCIRVIAVVDGGIEDCIFGTFESYGGKGFVGC